MEHPKTMLDEINKIEDLHREAQIWISTLHFTKDELIFIEKLLHSYVFETDTPNLFERLQEYLSSLEHTKKHEQKLEQGLISYETELGGLLECQALDNLSEIEKRHNQMADQCEEFLLKFKMLKSEIFNYAGSILRKRKK